MGTRRQSTLTRPRERPGARALAVEGLLQSLGQSLAESYLSAFALFLGAGALALGLTVSLPTAATALAQAAIRRRSAPVRRAHAFIARLWTGQAFFYALVGSCVFLPGRWAVPALLALVAAAFGCGGLAVPRWTALVAATVPRERHGWFFGLRGASQQAGVMTAILGGGALLSWMRGLSAEATGFLSLFLLAGVVRVGSACLMLGAAGEPREVAPAAARPLGFRGASRKFRRLAFYLWGVHFGTNVATPFFVPYMLVRLEFPYWLVGLLLAVPAAVKILTVRGWGRLADRTGPGPILRATGWLIAVVPLLWLVSGSPWWILVAQLVSGLSWGAFELSQASSLLQTTRGRPQLVGSFNLADGAMTLGGGLLGGLVVHGGEAFGLSGYLTAMAVSSALRLLPAVFLLSKIRGIGRPPWAHRWIPMRLWSVRPSRGMSLRPWNDLPPAEESGPAARRDDPTR